MHLISNEQKKRQAETMRCERQNKVKAFCPCYCWMKEMFQKQGLNAPLVDERASQDIPTKCTVKEQDVFQTQARCVLRCFSNQLK